jgi:hypothetical protein
LKIWPLILCVFSFFGCRPEQEATEWNVTISPQVGESVESSTLEDTPILISYKVEDDEESVDLSFELVEKPKNGVLKDCKYLNKKEWQCFYYPNKNFFGEDKLAFKNKDGDFLSTDKAYINIKIIPVADLPIAGPIQEFTLKENSKIEFKINMAKDPDTKDSDIKYVVEGEVQNGELVNCFSGPKNLDCTYIPNPEFYGQDQFSYKVIDDENPDVENPSSSIVKFNVLKEWIPVNGVSSIKIEDEGAKALIVFALDTSGSMKPYIDHMKQSVMNFVDDITTRGFKATIAFINSDQGYKVYRDEYRIEQPHPKFLGIPNSWLKTWDRVPKEDAVKIFEIDAYDAEWNEDTRNVLKNTKDKILDFLSNLPEGEDDERLLCSTLRFLKSDYIKDKKFVGVFSLSNEDDALKAVNLQKAYNDCHNKHYQENVPLNSCEEVIACKNGEEGCTPSWIYTYTKIDKKPYSAQFKGKCERSVANYVFETQNWRKGEIHTPKTKTVSEEICDPNLIKIQSWRKGTIKEVVTKKENIIECRDEWKKYEVWRRGVQTLPKMVSEQYTECKLEWETLDNPDGCKTLTRSVQDGYQSSQNKFEKGSCESLSAAVKPYWKDCVNENKQTFDGCKVVGQKDVPTGQIKTINKNEQGICSDLTTEENTLWANTCEDFEKEVDDGCRNVNKQVPDGFKIESINEKGTCDTLTANFSTPCIDYTKEVKVRDGNKNEEYECVKNGGMTCADHSFVEGSCVKVRDAGYNPPVLTPGQVVKTNIEKTCLEATGHDVCDSIVWDGKKTIVKTQGCALKVSSTVYQKFPLAENSEVSLASALVHKFKSDFVKAVYVSVAHDLQLNTEAIKKSEVEKLPLPSATCERYIERRTKFNGVIDGVEFMKVVKGLGEYGSSHSICSPEKYPSEKLDYLVGDAQLTYEIPESKTYDKVEVTGVKTVYASGESKVLTALDFTYADGRVTLVDPLLGKNLVEIQMTYKGFKK